MWLHSFSHSLLVSGFSTVFACVEAHQHQHVYLTRIKNTLLCCIVSSPSAQQNNPSSPQQRRFLHLLLSTRHVKLHPSSSLLGVMPNPPSSHWHAKHFTPFILSTSPLELSNCRDPAVCRIWSLSSVPQGLLWKPFSHFFSRKITSTVPCVYCITGWVAALQLTSHLHFNITLHRWLEVISVLVWVA